MYSGEILLHAAFLKYIYQMVGRLPIREHGNERTRLLRLLSSFFPPFACLFVAILPVLDLAFPGATGTVIRVNREKKNRQDKNEYM